MPASLPSILLLSFCWIASLAILLIFLESWFSVTQRNRFVARRASGAYGVCTVFLFMRGAGRELEKTVRSIFGQSYPFIELFLIYPEDNEALTALAHELRAIRTHAAVRLVPVSHGVDSSADRIRALELIQPSARGRWYVLVDGGVLLDRFAIEASMEFAGSGEVSALALRPGTQASSFIYRVLAPSMEYLFQILRVVERRRLRSRPLSLEAPYLLLNREAFEVVHRINKMPGILNEAGWNLWSYQAEGLRTFDGDGSRWLWCEIGRGSWPSYSDLDKRVARHAAGLMAAATLASLIPVAGLLYVFLVPMATLWEASILAISTVSYTLVTISYFLHARKLHAASWFAPLWFLVQPVAAVLTFLGVRDSLAQSRSGRETVVNGGSDGRGGGRETFRHFS